MKKSQKSEIVAKIQYHIEKSDVVFVINQNKMTVADAENLRGLLRPSESKYMICKNTLAELAMGKSNFRELLPYLVGQTALVFSKDITGAAKVIHEYASKNEEKFSVVCGEYAGKVLNKADVKMLATLPSMDELRAKIIAVIQTPAQRLATLLQAPACQISRVLKAYAEK